MTTTNTFEPQVVAFCCNYCAYAAADVAGASRIQYPPNVRVVLLPCTGKLDILHALKAFESGADGIMVAG
jgi:coenzyme F420-reducing hydrogenase delta subunit